jgi:hypothetical protein
VTVRNGPIARRTHSGAAGLRRNIQPDKTERTESILDCHSEVGQDQLNLPRNARALSEAPGPAEPAGAHRT